MNSAGLTDFSTDFMKYRGPAYPSYTGESKANNLTDLDQTSSWLHGSDFNSLAGDLFSTTQPGSGGVDVSYGNLTGMNLNLDQIKIGDQTMENVLKALDPSGTKPNYTGYNSNTNTNTNSYANANYANNIYTTSNTSNGGNSFLNGLNLDTSFTLKPTGGPKSSKYDNFDYLKPTNRSNIIKSHNVNHNTTSGNKVSFQHPPTSQFFSSPDESFVNMTLPAMDTSLIFSDKKSIRPASSHQKSLANVPTYSQDQREKEQFVAFAVQQYRMLAGLNPEMMREPENLEELADRETFKYWAKLFVEERERQARIVLNMQKALTEALSGSAAKGPNVMSHLGAATGDFELETIGKYADQCRKRSQMISNYFNKKK